MALIYGHGLSRTGRGDRGSYYSLGNALGCLQSPFLSPSPLSCRLYPLPSALLRVTCAGVAAPLESTSANPPVY